MNKEILNTVYQEFINSNLNADIKKLALKKNLFTDIDLPLLLQQIQSKLKSKSKLPSWFNTEGIYYPKPLNIGQSSSEITAAYKATIIDGNSLIDLSMGFGVDSYYFSKKIDKVVGCEIDKELFEIVDHNFSVLKTNNIIRINEDGLSILKSSDSKYDWIYVDPSRRNDLKGKVFKFRDSLPNIIPELSTMVSMSKNVMIKSSPLIDLTAGISELKYVRDIHIVAVNNELKELLWILDAEITDQINIKCINLGGKKQELFEFKWGEEESSNANLGDIKQYLYEPNVSILKSGAFNLLAERFHLNKIHQHSHLYSSDLLIDFPGRAFNIQSVYPYNKKALKKLLPDKANVSIRNFPKSVEQLRKEFSIKDGGSDYLFFSTDHKGKKILIWCKKPDEP